MRMWMVNPKKMCDQHLLGEHVELHMIVGTIRKKKSINGYIENDLIEISSIEERHEELADEMLNRGMNHKSDLPGFNIEYLDGNIIYHKINKYNAKLELISRCEKCRRRT